MLYKKIGPVEIITGENNSRVPYCTSLLVHGKKEDALIDCGSGQPAFDYIKEQADVRNIFLTHYHLDHTWGANRFNEATKWINPYDWNKLSDPYELAAASGITAQRGKEATKAWLERQKQKEETARGNKPLWMPVMDIADRVYPFEEPIEIANTTMTVLHTPGHTEGYCCPYFPEYGVMYVGDFDLTSFGPWYMNADSDIDAFFESSKRTLEVDANYYVTGHHKGTFERAEYEHRLSQYMDKIHEREEKTKNAIQKGVPPKDIVYQEIIYLLKNHRQSKRFLESEVLGIAKHIQHLIKQGYPFENYFRAFANSHGIHTGYLNYKSTPQTQQTERVNCYSPTLKSLETRGYFYFGSGL